METSKLNNAKEVSKKYSEEEMKEIKKSDYYREDLSNLIGKKL